MDVAIFCWVLTINRGITQEEYLACAQVVQEVWPESTTAARLKDAPPSLTMLHEVLCQLLPLLMMRQQRLPRSKWRQFQTERGKKWIERDPDGMHPSRHLASMMGYTTCADHNMVVLAAAQGKKHQVVNIGLNVKVCAVEPVGVTVHQWAQSLGHKLTDSEKAMLSNLPDEKLVSRLVILLTIKESLINGLGQPVGFDLSRIDCSINEERICVDGVPLLGWEWRIFRTEQQGVQGNGTPFNDVYQITVAFYRGNNLTKFMFVENPRDIQGLTQYFPLDNLLKVTHKLTE